MVGECNQVDHYYIGLANLHKRVFSRAAQIWLAVALVHSKHPDMPAFSHTCNIPYISAVAGVLVLTNHTMGMPHDRRKNGWLFGTAVSILFDSVHQSVRTGKKLVFPVIEQSWYS